MKQIVSKKDLTSINTMLFELTCLRRWSEVTVEGGKYTELGKQALNCMISYFWATEIQHAGQKVNFNWFPKIAILRGFTKDYQCDVPESNLDIIFHLGNVSKESFDEMIQQRIQKELSQSFYDWLQVDSDLLELRIYRAATKVATLLELEEIKNGISLKDYDLKREQLQTSIESFSDLPGFDLVMSEKYLEIFRNFSKLRNRIRWAKHPNIIKCGVLGHHFDVAVYAYLMSLEVNPLDEELATRYFFMGVFHDFPESWTGDMPSPVKDAIPGLREATELFENQVMQENVYNHLPDYQVKAIRHTMLEDSENASLKKFLKKSDNFSAFIECWREIDAGSRHSYYFKVARNSFGKKEDLTHNFRLLLEELYYSFH